MRYTTADGTVTLRATYETVGTVERTTLVQTYKTVGPKFRSGFAGVTPTGKRAAFSKRRVAVGWLLEEHGGRS